MAWSGVKEQALRRMVRIDGDPRYHEALAKLSDVPDAEVPRVEWLWHEAEPRNEAAVPDGG